MIITDDTLSQCKQPIEIINPYLYQKIKIKLYSKKRWAYQLEELPAVVYSVTNSEREVKYWDFLKKIIYLV